MARRADPERIYAARRAAIRNTLTATGMPLPDAEAWLRAWELESARRGVPTTGDYWTVGSAWIAEQRAQRRKPGG
jgi:hypothetical protein